MYGDNTNLHSIAVISVVNDDSNRGQKLFMGYSHFQNGGPACMGCHNIASNGILGGGGLGPDLTDSTTRFSLTYVAAIISNTGPIISPVMNPIYIEHPLTEAEQADLLDFLVSSAGLPQTNYETLILLISFGGFITTFILIGFIYGRRLRGVRKPFLKQLKIKN